MNSTEELFQAFLHVSFVESTCGGNILYVGLCLFQSLVNSLTIIKPSGKVHNLGPDENICPADGLFKLNPLQRSAPAECHVCLPSGKYTTCEIDDYPAESEPLTLMNSYRPSQPNRILSKAAQYLFFYFFGLFIVTVADVPP